MSHDMLKPLKQDTGSSWMYSWGRMGGGGGGGGGMTTVGGGTTTKGLPKVVKL